MIPALETTIGRPWQWGIVIVGDSRGGIPLVEPGSAVSIGPEAEVNLVRHAHDVEIPGDASGDAVPLASADVHVCVGTSTGTPDRPVVCDVILAIPSPHISTGDANGQLVIEWANSHVRIVASANELDLVGVDEVWVDLHGVAG